MIFGLFFIQDENGKCLELDCVRAITKFGGILGTAEEAIDRACEEHELDPTNEKHRELVVIEDEDNYAYYLEEGTPMDAALEFYELPVKRGESRGYVGFKDSILRSEPPLKFSDMDAHMLAFSVLHSGVVQRVLNTYGSDWKPQWVVVESD